MIPRFYDATEGSVLVDNVPVTERKLQELRSAIGIAESGSHTALMQRHGLYYKLYTSQLED